MTENMENVAHLRATSGDQEVERKAELEAYSEMPGEVARHEDEGAWRSRSSWRQWRCRLCRRRVRERDRVSWRALGECGGGHDILDGIDGLTSGANAGVRAPNGIQVLRWSATMANKARHESFR